MKLIFVLAVAMLLGACHSITTEPGSETVCDNPADWQAGSETQSLVAGTGCPLKVLTW
ncbi:MAG: hypothetical protein IPO38_08850 [Rhodocyclaceae bacterium]|nr:hypothetical protein [Rhodocyclaceae bacterium]